MFSGGLSDKNKLSAIYEVEVTETGYRFPKRTCGYHSNIEDLTLWRAEQNQSLAYLDQQKMIKKMGTTMLTDLNQYKALYKKAGIHQRRALLDLIHDFLDS